MTLHCSNTASISVDQDIRTLLPANQVARKTEAQIDEARMSYKPCARNVSILFFTISDMAAIEPMYQYSLAWFVRLFEDTIHTAEKFPSVPRRIEALICHFTYSLYRNVSR